MQCTVCHVCSVAFSFKQYGHLTTKKNTISNASGKNVKTKPFRLFDDELNTMTSLNDEALLKSKGQKSS